MKLTSIGLENFRIFKRKTDFRIKPLTIIAGPNSSGKSSIAKALLLLQDNLQKNELGFLQFNNPQHGLGTFNSIANSGDSIRFEIQYDDLNWDDSILIGCKKLNISMTFTQTEVGKEMSRAKLTNFSVFDQNKKSILEVNDNLEKTDNLELKLGIDWICLLYTSPSPRDATLSRMPSSA